MESTNSKPLVHFVNAGKTITQPELKNNQNKSADFFLLNSSTPPVKGEAITASQFSDAVALAKAVPYEEFASKANQTRLISEDYVENEKLLQKELDSAKATLESMKKSKQTRSQVEKVSAENRVLSAEVALWKNISQDTRYQMQKMLEENKKMEDKLTKRILALEEREQDFQLSSIGNMLNELLKRHGLVNAYRVTFNIPNSTIVTPGSILFQLEANNINGPSTVTSFFVTFLQTHLPNLSLNDVQLLNRKFSRIRNEIAHTVLKSDVVDSIGKFDGVFRQTAEKVFSEYFGETFGVAWNQLYPSNSNNI